MQSLTAKCYNAPMEQDNSREHLLRKLHKVFKDGYRPTRGNETYFADDTYDAESRTFLVDRVNCFGHSFNLRNQQFNDYGFKSYKLYGHFDSDKLKQPASFAQDFLDFVKETGLLVTECDPYEPINDFKSWKIALYFAPKDFHVLLEDAPQKWSSKLGFGGGVAWRPKLPLKYHIARQDYDFYNTYQITNPNADENNRYIKERTR